MEPNDTNDFSDLTSMDHECLPDQDKSYNKPGPKPKELTEGTFMGLPVGRDKKVIDPEDVQKLAALGCKDRDLLE